MCEKVTKAKVATSNYVQDDCKRVGGEWMLLKHPCTGKLRKKTLPRGTVCKTVNSESCQGQLCARR